MIFSRGIPARRKAEHQGACSRISGQRYPVKQALQRLAEEKLVVNTPNKGMSVRALTPHELQDIFDMRLMMDTFFVKDIVTTLNYNHGLRQQLIDCLEAQKIHRIK